MDAIVKKFDVDNDRKISRVEFFAYDPALRKNVIDSYLSPLFDLIDNPRRLVMCEDVLFRVCCDYA